MIDIKICGIICEYNPLHAGHVYQMRQARELTGADAVVCLMSGQFVQRGENAVFDKFTRARMAIEKGADAVVELPQVFSLQSAEYFAFGAVLCAEALGCTHLCFGSEAGELESLSQEATPSRSALDGGLSYAQAMDRFEGQPNNLLGAEYLKAIRELNSPLIPVTLKRNDGFASAGKLRDRLAHRETHPDMVPAGDVQPLFFESFFPLIKYRLLTLPESRLKNICGVNEGLEFKLKKEVLSARSAAELIGEVKSKRYTYTRISRILSCTLLDITKDKLNLLFEKPPKCKLLAVKKEKTILLSALSGYYISPVDAANMDESTALSSAVNTRATQVYSIFSPLHGDEDYTMGLMKI